MEHLPDDPNELLNAMKQTDTLQFFDDFVLIYFQKKLQNEIMPQFIKAVFNPSCENLLAAIEKLFKSVDWFFDYVKKSPSWETLNVKLNGVLEACLTWSVKESDCVKFVKLYAYCFQFQIWGCETTDCIVESSCTDDYKETVPLQWAEYKERVSFVDFNLNVMSKFYHMTKEWLPSLNLMHKFCELPVLRMLETEIDSYIIKNCSDEFDQHWMDYDGGKLITWLDTQVGIWLNSLFQNNYNHKRWMQTLKHFMFTSYTRLRISEMLSIITDYPDSSPVLCDLKFCLQHTRLRPRLIQSLKSDFQNRVLHPGVSTQSIISVYISAVKALRELDDSGVIMEMVLEPYTTYLTQRDDAVRMIMRGLLGDDGSNDLAAELAERQKPNDGRHYNETATEHYEDWLPDPREADPNKSDKSSRTSDVVTLFIRMYGSKEKFIKEYQKLLSKRLLQTWYAEKSESSEIRNLELLKVRFGEDDMNKCEVMLKDMTDSKRINSYVKEEFWKKEKIKSDMDIRTMVISSQFWPEFPELEFELPPVVNASLESFGNGFKRLKASRFLTCIRGTGLVDIDLEFEDRKLNIRVTPLQASIIHHFQDKNSCSLENLSDALKIPPTSLRRKMAFWLQQGVIRETSIDNYQVVEKDERSISGTAESNSLAMSSSQRLQTDYDDEEERADSDDEDKNDKEEQIFWSYVQGMLKNFETLPLDRIHKMLQMFAVHDADMQIEQPRLRRFLNSKVQAGLLTVEQGKYKLVKDSG